MLARKLFEWEIGGHYDTFFDAAITYADVLGEEGLAENRRLAEERWARVPVLGPGEKDSQGRHGQRFRISHVMETLAWQEGDIGGQPRYEPKPATRLSQMYLL